jgi:hypothetical protein
VLDYKAQAGHLIRHVRLVISEGCGLNDTDDS